MTQTCTRFDEIGRQHGRLLDQITELRRLASPLGGSERGAAARARLVREIGGLCQGMRRHFAFEEEGGYLDAVVAARPGLFFNVSRLQREHAEFLREGESLSADLQGPLAPEEARTRLVRLLDQLGRHQYEEHQLLQQAIADDLGGGD